MSIFYVTVQRLTFFRRYLRRASSASQNEAATLDNLSLQLVELRLTLESLERERDFYFGKLADIEQVVVAGDFQDNKIRQAVRDILYQAEVIPGWCQYTKSLSLQE